MTSDLAKLMEYIDSLQSEAVPEPVVEIEEPKVHPLLQAMQELREEEQKELEEYNIRKTKKFIQRAHDKEQGQMYGNMPYSSHPKQVANLGKKFFGAKFNDEAVKVALLHDILEDTPYTPEQLAKKGFSKEVITAVQLLTKNKSLTYADNIRAIINSGNKLAMMVKYCDNYMNYTGDKSHWTPERAAHSQKKYLASLNMLGDVLGIKKHVGDETIEEASPDTLEGSFTPDLVESKTWLANMLAKGLKGKNAGTIYVLGSWYGNMGIFLQQAGVKFDKLVLVEPDQEALMRSKELLDTLNDDGKLILIHQNAEDIVYEKPGVVINTSCNETGPVFLTKLPDNMLCLLQARNNNEDSLFPTEQLEDFVDYFPLEKVYYTGEKQLEDPEVNYTRFMKIGRSGKKLDETVSTGLGGGSAGSSGGQMVGGPTTYEQENDMFKSKGPRRITAMTNEALDSSYPYEKKSEGKYNFTTDDGVYYKVYFQGKDLVEVAFSAILPGETDTFRPDKTTLTGTGDSRKVFGTVIKIIQEYLGEHQPNAMYFTAGAEPSRIKLYSTLISQVEKALPDYYATKTIDLGDGKAYMIKRREAKVNEDAITLNKLYSDNKPDDNEQIWDYGTMIWDTPFEINKISARELDWQLCHQYDVEHIDDLFDRMSEEQHDIVNNYINDPNLSNYIIVTDNGHIVDGNHRAIAAALTGKSLRYIDIGEEDILD